MADLSEDDKNILEAFHALTVKPKITKPEDLISFMKHMGETLKEDPEGKGEIMDPNAMMGQGAIPKVGTQHNYPRISIFYGDDSNKGEVSWPTFKFEVEALVKGGSNHIRSFIKIPFINKGIDFIDLPSIFQDKSVIQSIPTYFQNSEPPIICYKYNKPIRNTIFNFNKLVSDLDIHANTPKS